MPQTLLLADDSLTIQRVIELTFAGEDIKVVAVSDGDQAIARLDSEPPDIVLADVGMPGRDGYEVAAYVKQSPRLVPQMTVYMGMYLHFCRVHGEAIGWDPWQAAGPEEGPLTSPAAGNGSRPKRAGAGSKRALTPGPKH